MVQRFCSPRLCCLPGLPGLAAMQQLGCVSLGCGPTGEGQLCSGLGTRSRGTGQGPAEDLTLKHKVKVLILVSRKTVTGDPIRKNRIKPWN